jgi:hypothetical protein
MHTDLDEETPACVVRLRQLPDEVQPPYNWQEFQRRSQQRVSPARDRLDWSHAAAAAVLVLVLGAMAAWLSAGKPFKAAIVAAQPIAAERPASNVQSPANRSEAIESYLANLPQEPVVVRVGTRAAVAGLEDRIAQVDDLLTSVRLEGGRPDRLASLQQERMRLIGSLAQVRYAEVVAAD